MKKLQFLAALAAALLATSCANEIDAPAVASGNETEVTLSLGLPSQIRTYAYGDGTTAKRLHYAVYEHTADGSVNAPVISGTDDAAFASGLSTTKTFKVITGVEYDFVFFADAPESPYVFDFATATVNDTQAVADGTIDGNLENRDAFFGVYTVKVTGAFNANVELRRPFAQLNLGTDDLQEAIVKNKFGESLENLKTSVKTETCANLNLLTGIASDKVAVTFGIAAIPSGESFPVAKDDTTEPPYEYLSMNYLLLPAELTYQNCEFAIYSGDSEVRSFIVPNAPMQRNFRTNIYGTLLISDGNISIAIIPDFEEMANNVEVSSSTVAQPVADGVLKTDDTYFLTNVNGLTWLAEQSNADNAAFAGKTIELAADVDFNNTAVAPMKFWCPENPVTFDGKGHTLKNMKFQGRYKSLIETMTGTVKNLNVDGMSCSTLTRRFSGLVANSYGNFENIHVKNVKLSSRDGRVGTIVGIHNGGDMINCSAENVEISAGWSVGGLAGAVNETPGFNYTNCVVKNVKVTNTGAYGGVYDKMTGVIVGNINLPNVVFTDCQIIDCDTELPIYNSFNDYTWNGTVIPADIDEEGNPLTPATTE